MSDNPRMPNSKIGKNPAEAGSGGGWSRSRRAELEELSVGDVFGLAGERAHQAAAALAAAGVFGLREPADGGGGERGEADANRLARFLELCREGSFRPQPMEMGRKSCG